MKRQITSLNPPVSGLKINSGLSPCKGDDTPTSKNGSSSRKRKKTPQEKLEELEKRKERELKKLSDCWTMSGGAVSGPRNRRSSLGCSPRVKSDFIHYDNGNECFDSLVTSENDTKSDSRQCSHQRSKSASVSYKDNGNNQDVKDKSTNDPNQPNCKRELTFSHTVQSDLQPLKLKIYKDSPQKKKSERGRQGSRSKEQEITQDSKEPGTEIKDFLPVRRKKLRSEVSEKELWEGFPVDIKVPRLKSKLLQSKAGGHVTDSESITTGMYVEESSKTSDCENTDSEPINTVNTEGNNHHEIQKDNTVGLKPAEGSITSELKSTHSDNTEDPKTVTGQGVGKKTVSFTPGNVMVSPGNNKVFTRLKAKTPEKYGFATTSKSELFQKLPEPSPRAKKPAHLELLDDMRLAKSACTLWVSEGRRRFQQENPNASSKQLDGLMRTAWNKLTVRQKLVYFVRAKSALEDKQTFKVAQAKKQSQKKEKSVDVPIEFFQELPGYEQDAILKRRLSQIQSQLSRSQYTALLSTFHHNYKELLCRDLDNSGRKLARQVLFKWICKVEGFIMDMKLERVVHYRNQLLQQYNALVENILSECCHDDSQSHVYSGGDHLSHSEQLCDILSWLENHEDNDNQSSDIKNDPAFKKILHGLESGSVTGVLNLEVSKGQVWQVPNVVNRENYRQLLSSALTEDLPVLDGNDVGEYLECLEKGLYTECLNKDWNYTSEPMYQDPIAVGDHVAESPVVFLDELIALG